MIFHSPLPDHSCLHPFYFKRLRILIHLQYYAQRTGSHDLHQVLMLVLQYNLYKKTNYLTFMKEEQRQINCKTQRHPRRQRMRGALQSLVHSNSEILLGNVVLISKFGEGVYVYKFWGMCFVCIGNCMIFKNFFTAI